MDKVVYLHIGTPKTGSSAIQFFCGNNRKLLKEKGVAYPKMPFAFEGIGQYRNAHFYHIRFIKMIKEIMLHKEKSIRKA